jgi:ketosteroid isomerase-like protein
MRLPDTVLRHLIELLTELLLRELDVAIDTATSDQDRAALELLLADDYMYTHSNGKSQSKAEFIAGVLARTNPPRRMLSDVNVELHGDIAVTRGNLDILYNDERTNLFMRYVRVYRLIDDRWQAISHRTVYATDRAP